MKFSKETLTVLKNFSTINQSILFKEGSEIKTISPQKTVMASANITEDIPSQAGIYDLARFLSVHSLFENPDIEFGDKFLTIQEGKRKTKYTYADPSMMILPPEKEVKIPSIDVEVDVSSSDIDSVMKAASSLRLPEIAFIGREGTCYLAAVDSGNPSSDTFEVELGDTEDDFQLIIKLENLNVLPSDYKVGLCSKGISKFTSDTATYFIAIESKSHYKKG
ncbi:MAG: hypothetical protein WCY93_07355 [Anaerolineaceae bacterium]